MRILIFFVCVLSFFHGSYSSVQAEDPWGKDAELAGFYEKPSANRKYTGSILSQLSQMVIRFHQVVLSPADGPRSHFYPCSSQYALVAIRKYGLLRGVPLACDRLMRENDDLWVYRRVYFEDDGWIKYDPVPEL